MSSVHACGLDTVQLALNPIREAAGSGPWALSHTKAVLANAGITILSGMIGTVGEDYTTLESIRETGGVRPDKHWQQNLHNARAAAEVAAALNLRLVTFHAGFVPHDPRDPEFATITNRLVQIADAFAHHNISIAFETGQESAGALAALLRAVSAAWRRPIPPPGVNFDPANMILYGSGDPIAALGLLAPHVRQVHIKDATPTTTPGTWGAEVPVGAGAVDWPAFFRLLHARCPHADMIIEREAGTSRIEDIRTALALVKRNG